MNCSSLLVLGRQVLVPERVGALAGTGGRGRGLPATAVISDPSEPYEGGSAHDFTSAGTLSSKSGFPTTQQATVTTIREAWPRGPRSARWGRGLEQHLLREDARAPAVRAHGSQLLREGQ